MHSIYQHVTVNDVVACGVWRMKVGDGGQQVQANVEGALALSMINEEQV
jgi:hypothetical protein